MTVTPRCRRAQTRGVRRLQIFPTIPSIAAAFGKDPTTAQKSSAGATTSLAQAGDRGSAATESISSPAPQAGATTTQPAATDIAAQEESER